ncbi:type II toxin-antitoxin system RatA family toxin [Nocardiopsis sp. B62]|jgi:ribosome-associated toxin RatA of RatAB toxin-antitoxin module|uniref:type II toxin-antitoxin system RatA family toxin n=1 Tax=Nocardiopsis sp. B62 TaxID=2824874 RepID=UPI001B3671DE|nr:SRPBCC family protein [Nocardiopsis sp. B62]MBQ1082437.1 SRPBCC family protein [Nocardiopsis sp. B62]
MPIVTVTERLQVSAEKVWDLVCDVASYPRFMESVISTSVLSESALENGHVEVVTEWEVQIKGSVLKWVEREIRYPERWRIDYTQQSGDLEVFQGFWQVVRVDDEVTEATLEVEFEIGVAMLKPMLEPVAARAIERNSSDMLLSLGRRVGV